MDDDFRKAALDYHRLPQPGKLAIEPTKRMATSAIWRSPIRLASPPPARPSWRTRRRRAITPRAAIWSR